LNHRENILALLNNEPHERVPIWLMGFENEDLARKLNPEHRFPDNISHNPETSDYPWDRISDEERERTLEFSKSILRPVVGIGWGANGHGHGGPGEFHYKLLDLKENERTLICETGVKRLVQKKPHFYKDFDYPMSSIGDVDKLELPDPSDPARYKGYKEDVRFFKEAGYYTLGNLNGFFSAAHYFCLDYEEFLMSLMTDPANAKKLIDRIGEWNMAAAEEMLKHEVDCIVLCDDLGSADNMLMSPDLYKELILPWHKRLVELAHDFKATVHLHSHGNITKILPLVLSTGVDMLDPFDSYESMDLVEYLESHPAAKTIPVGGLHKFIFEWDRDRQRDYLNALFKNANKAGRWMLMDTGGIPSDVDKEGYDFFMEQLRELQHKK